MSADSSWSFIPLSEFKPPAEPVVVEVQRGLRRLWHFLRTQKNGVPKNLEDDLESPSQKRLDWLIPAPNWDQMCQDYLEESLTAWLQGDPDEVGHQTFVTVPYNGVHQMIRSWASSQGLRMFKPPGRKQLLEDSDAWLGNLQTQAQACKESNTRLVLPHLGRCYLRHQNGLDLIYRLLDWLANSNYPCLIMCDSWAWAYLDRVVRISSILSEPKVLAPVDAKQLAMWFYQLSSKDGLRAVNFRKTTTGKVVIGPRERTSTDLELEASADQLHTTSEFLEYLAAFSRGNPGIAWWVWRKHLLLAADEDANEFVKQMAAADGCITIWIPRHEALETELPLASSKHIHINEAFILHTMLLHNTVPADLFPELLPLTATEIHSSLQVLQDDKLIELNPNNSSWAVSLGAYQGVYKLLRRNGFLVSSV